MIKIIKGKRLLYEIVLIELKEMLTYIINNIHYLSFSASCIHRNKCKFKYLVKNLIASGH